MKVAGQLEQAAVELRQAAKLAPRNRIPLNELGGVLLAQERYAEAKQAYEQSLAIEPNYLTYTNLASVLELEGNYEGAVANLQKALELRKDSSIAWGNLGSAYLWAKPGDPRGTEAFTKAAELAEKERQRNPNDAELLSTLGSYYACLGKADAAQPLLRKSIALSPDNANVAYRVGEAFEIMGNRRDAIQWVSKAIELGYSRKYVDRNPELRALREDRDFQRALLVLGPRNP
jgi:eukaryotic-like serine/threonine-protein kinase